MKISKLLIKSKINFFIIIFVFLLDRISKYFILDFFLKFPDQNIFITSFLSFNLLWNEGIAFGLLQFEHNTLYNIITLLIFSVICVITWLGFKSEGLEKISYLIIVGGGLGNIFDRLYYGAVIDFIDLNYNNFHWFIFNVADIFITIGVLILIFSEFIKKKMFKTLSIGLILFLAGCGLGDALTLKKKSPVDEFLVEKKSPLVIPPDFGKLPVPKKNQADISENNINKDTNEIENLLIDKKNNSPIDNQSQSSSVEDLILEKIK